MSIMWFLLIFEIVTALWLVLAWRTCLAEEAEDQRSMVRQKAESAPRYFQGEHRRVSNHLLRSIP
jgi:hypothetical protein